MFKGSFPFKVTKEKVMFLQILLGKAEMEASRQCRNAAAKKLAASLSTSCELISGDKTGTTTMSSIVINKKTCQRSYRTARSLGREGSTDMSPG